MADTQEKWYYNLSTKQVEQGKNSQSLDRMGPYDTKEEAQQALEIAAARTKAADEYDEAYEDERP